MSDSLLLVTSTHIYDLEVEPQASNFSTTSWRFGHNKDLPLSWTNNQNNSGATAKGLDHWNPWEHSNNHAEAFASCYVMCLQRDRNRMYIKLAWCKHGANLHPSAHCMLPVIQAGVDRCQPRLCARRHFQNGNSWDADGLRVYVCVSGSCLFRCAALFRACADLRPSPFCKSILFVTG